LTILVVGRTCWRFSDRLRGIGGAAPIGRRGFVFEVPGGGGGGGALPRGTGIGSFPEPAMVEGRFAVSRAELVLGRGTFSDTVDAGRSAENISRFIVSFELPPVFTPPFVDRNFGIPPANSPPSPGAAPIGGGGAENEVSALPALFALARVFNAGGLNPAPGIGAVPPIGAGLLVDAFPTC
jgi:hypothetical protein